MSFGEQLKKRREELSLSRGNLAIRLGVSPSAVSNYENDLSFPKEAVMMRLFDSLETDPNTLFQGYFHQKSQTLTRREQQLLEQYRRLSSVGKESVLSVVGAMCQFQEDLEEQQPEQDLRYIPLFHSPAAAGYVSPVFGEDFDSIPVTEDVPRGAEFAVRIQGDSMSPYIPDNSIVYVNRDPLGPGDVGIFCVDGDMFCKQYYRDPAGVVYLFSLNRQRADADLVLMPGSTRTLVCFGRVILQHLPLPGKK